MYPQHLKERGTEGTVVVLALVDTLGSVANAQIADSSENAELDQAALDAVRLFRYLPARAGENKVAVWVRQEIIFAARR